GLRRGPLVRNATNRRSRDGHRPSGDGARREGHYPRRDPVPGAPRAALSGARTAERRCCPAVENPRVQALPADLSPIQVATMCASEITSGGSATRKKGTQVFERFTERARQVVVLAQDEARALKHNYIGTEHILLGLLREEEGLAARVLESLDITVEEVR